VDIVLATHTDDPFLALSNLERLGDDSGFVCDLTVVSSGFSAHDHRFYFGAPELRTCIENLRLMNETLSGSARLFQQYEADNIEFFVDSFGHLWVAGDLLQFGDREQRLHWEFRSDQTVLVPLIRGLSEAAAMPVKEAPTAGAAPA